MSARHHDIANRIIPYLLLLIGAGMLWSRALLSLALAAFLLTSLLAAPWAEHLRFLRKHPVLLLFPLWFLPPLVSGLWSTDTAAWLRILQLKAPLLLIPLGGLPLSRMDRASLRRLAYMLSILLVADILRSIGYFVIHRDTIVDAYLQAKVLPVGMHQDHVRYGWMLVVVWMICLWLRQQPAVAANRMDRHWLNVLICLIFFFQHLLASKTGLLGTYVTGLVWLILQARAAARRWAWLLLLAPLAAYAVLPTFRNRLRFVRWDFQHYTRGSYTEGLSDAPRLISMQAGWNCWQEQPWLGTGFGDLRAVIHTWYSNHQAGLKPYEQLLPSNEFLYYGAASGWLGFLLACFAALAPFFLASCRKQFLWLGFHLVTVLGFLYEIGLETQFGILLYAVAGSWIYVLLTKDDVTASVAR